MCMKRSNKLLIVAIIGLIGFALACSNEETVNKPLHEQQMTHEEGEDTTARELGFFDRKKAPFNSKTLSLFTELSKKHKLLSFFCVTQQGTFFIKQNQSQLFNTKGDIHSKTRFGLVDEKGKQVLATEYQTIGNPGLLGDGFMEIKKDNVYGIYDYVNNVLIAPQFDVIFPSEIQEYIAIGNKNGQLYKIYANGKLKEIPSDKSGPNYINILKKFRFNYDSDFYGMWYETSAFEYLDDVESYDDLQLAGMVPPSYLNQLKVLPQLYTGIIANSDSLDYISVEAKPRSTETTSMLSELFQYATESRGAEWKEHYLSTFNNRNSVQSSVKILTTGNYYNLYVSKQGKPSVRFLNDSLVEVKNFVTNEFDQALPYSNYTKYEYYSIASNGKITAINEGFFPMTAAIEINRNHFKGCFQRFTSDDETRAMPNYDEDMEGMPMYLNTDHLSADDIELMKNEIYARHGKKFSDPKWTTIFKTQKWYKPKSGNVDALLTPIEKKNLEVIQRLLKEVKSNPKKFIHSEADYYVAAG